MIVVLIILLVGAFIVAVWTICDHVSQEKSRIDQSKKYQLYDVQFCVDEVVYTQVIGALSKDGVQQIIHKEHGDDITILSIEPLS